MALQYRSGQLRIEQKRVGGNEQHMPGAKLPGHAQGEICVVRKVAMLVAFDPGLAAGGELPVAVVAGRQQADNPVDIADGAQRCRDVGQCRPAGEFRLQTLRFGERAAKIYCQRLNDAEYAHGAHLRILSAVPPALSLTESAAVAMLYRCHVFVKHWMCAESFLTAGGGVGKLPGVGKQRGRAIDVPVKKNAGGGRDGVTGREDARQRSGQ